MFNRILVPLDGSRYSSRSLEYAEELAQKFNSEIILMRVVEPSPPIPPTTGAAPDMVNPAATKISVKAALREEKINRKRAAKYLARKARESSIKNEKLTYTTRTGSPALSIIEFSKSENIDLIVMTTHGEGGIKRAFLGSVADEVVRESGKPVLVFNPSVKD
jgi:nucleotide-binding universal stress UspA family protein